MLNFLQNLVTVVFAGGVVAAFVATFYFVSKYGCSAEDYARMVNDTNNAHTYKLTKEDEEYIDRLRFVGK